jgi:glutamine amidotransferase
VIAILDVCSGNLRSVERALQHVGGDVRVTNDPEVVRAADKIVVPGQGSFDVFMQALGKLRLAHVLATAIVDGKPYLGICLGLQILFEESDEGTGKWREGLGWLPGRITKLAPADRTLKVPHMGWNRVVKRHDDPLLAGIADDAYFYFVHSYHAPLGDNVVLETEHGVPFCAALRKDNVFACQFHPEKSQAVGLRLLRNFVEAR